MRQQAFLQTDQIDVREFQSLGRVQGHQGNRVALQFFFLVRIVAVIDGHGVQKAAERRLAGLLLVAADRVDDLFDRLPTGFKIVGVGIGASQFFAVSQGGHQVGGGRGQGPALGKRRLPMLDQPHETADAIGRPGGDTRNAIGLL